MMPATTSMSSKTGAVNTPGEGAVLAALRELPPDYRADVLRTIEFLDYKINSAGDQDGNTKTIPRDY